MSDPIDPTRGVRTDRRSQDRRGARRRAGDDKSQAAAPGGSNLPVPIDQSRAAAPDPEPVTDTGAATFAAQLYGQVGQKRGLKGGQPVLDSARSAYLEAEFSGQRERRIRLGRFTKTKI